MGRILTILLLALWTLSGASLAAPSRLPAVAVPPTELPTVAVLPFDMKAKIPEGLTPGDAGVVSDYIYDALVNSGSFDVLEREHLDKLLDEQALGQSGLINVRTAAELGRMIGAQYIVCGSITGLGLRRSRDEFAGLGLSRSRVYVHVTARLIETATGRVRLAGRGSGRATNTMMHAHSRTIRIGTDEVDLEQVHKALENAADRLVNGKKGFLKRMREFLEHRDDD
ncbi:MAG: hypothetical protein IJU05_00595 [Schwartzia sp.]|nr:hypothetical protein [Schwartzia sp. (in: firmicutes)]